MKTLEERFWAKVDKRGPDDCWLWTASTKQGGYGRIRVDGKTEQAHRVSWELENGPIPEHDSYHGMCVCHTCDNPTCVNPAHLFLGTNTDNSRDRDQKGRGNQPKGEKHNNAKLTEDAVRNIRRYYAAGGCTQKWLAQVYGVTKKTIYYLLHYKTWRHI